MKYKTHCCNDVIECIGRYNVVYCRCGKCYVDGGDKYDQYVRIVFEEGTLPPEPISKEISKQAII